MEGPALVVEIAGADDAAALLDDDPAHEVLRVVPDLIAVALLLDGPRVVRVAAIAEDLVALVIAGREEARGDRLCWGHGETLPEARGLSTLRGRQSGDEVELLAELQHAHGAEVRAVDRRHAQLAQRLAVIDRRVAAVVLPAVARVLRREALHEPVARDLRDDRRGRDRERLYVALDDLGVAAGREGRVEDALAVDEHPVVLTDLPERPLHRDVARVVDVQPVDLRHGRGADADSRDAPADLRHQLLALDAREDLRIVHAPDELHVRGHETRGRDDGPRERGHAHFVDADDAQQPLGPEGFLLIEGWHKGKD